ncbi:MAG: UvrB/UvrC motif-containing protein [Phycisphaeraceae bacterium]|nr:MAG: UvrB/UvrC motif-containing protein [Phycisphaeraceae bacterium]
MKCDHCDNEATVHEVTIKDGVNVERHLCEQCAATEGLAPAAGPVELIKAVLESQVGPRSDGCPLCGTTFDEFRHQTLLGCPGCYEAFESRLAPLIERAHEGATQHVGRAPRATEGAAVSEAARERAMRVMAIRRMLDEAVSSEQFERAAQLRDELRRLTGEGAPR